MPSTPAEALAQLKQEYERVYRTHGLSDHPAYYQQALRLLDLKPGQRLLDVGCGSGDLVAMAERAGIHAAGLDLAEAAIEIGKRSAPAADLRSGDASTLPWPENSFDGVACLGSLENMPDPNAVLAEIRRVLKADGRFVVLLPNMYWLGDVVEAAVKGNGGGLMQQYERQGSYRQWRDWLELRGWNLLRSERYNRRVPLFKDGKMRSIKKFVWRNFFNTICPYNLSWCFYYVCQKQPKSSNGPALCWLLTEI